MRKQTVLKTDSLNNIINDTFIYCKEEGKGFIGRNITSLELTDYSFTNVISELEQRSAQDLIDLGMDPHIFINGQTYQSQIVAKKVLEEVDALNLTPEERLSALNARYLENRMMGNERTIPVIHALSEKVIPGKVQFYTPFNLKGKKVFVTTDGINWSINTHTVSVEWFGGYFRVTMPNGLVSGTIIKAKVNLFDDVVVGGIKNKKLTTPTITSSKPNGYIGEEFIFTLNTTETNYSSINWTIIGAHELVDGHMNGDTSKTITVRGISPATLVVSAQLVGGEVVDKIRYLTSNYANSVNSVIQAPITLPTPTFNIQKTDVMTGENIQLVASFEIPPYDSYYEWEITGVSWTGTLTNTQIQNISVDVSGQIQIRVRVVKDTIGFINSAWSVVRTITATQMTGPMQFNDSNNTEPPSFIEGELFSEIDPGTDTTDNISKYL